MLYEVAIIERPTPKAAEDGACERLVFGPAAVVAKDEQGAVLAAAELMHDREQKLSDDTPTESVPTANLEVLVRPFRESDEY